MQASVGEICDAWRGYIDISGEWKTAADEALGIDFHESRIDLFTARAASLSVLTTKILTRAGEMPKLLSSGAIESMVVNTVEQAKAVLQQFLASAPSRHSGLLVRSRAWGISCVSNTAGEWRGTTP